MSVLQTRAIMILYEGSVAALLLSVVSFALLAMRKRTLPWECYKSMMLWELEPRVLDKSAMPLQAYRLRPTGLQRACQQALRAKHLLTRSISICDAGNNLEIRILNLDMLIPTSMLLD